MLAKNKSYTDLDSCEFVRSFVRQAISSRDPKKLIGNGCGSLKGPRIGFFSFSSIFKNKSILQESTNYFVAGNIQHLQNTKMVFCKTIWIPAHQYHMFFGFLFEKWIFFSNLNAVAETSGLRSLFVTCCAATAEQVDAMDQIRGVGFGKDSALA